MHIGASRPADGGASSFLWSIHLGSNRLELGTVNQFGIDGPISTAEIEL
jgi:hypothetical protein